MLNDLLDNVFCDFDFKHRCLKQKMEMNIHTVTLQSYEYIYEQSAFSPLQFLSIKTSALPKKHLALHTSQPNMAESLNKEDVMKSLNEIQITEQVHRHVRKECLVLIFINISQWKEMIAVITSPW